MDKAWQAFLDYASIARALGLADMRKEVINEAAKYALQSTPKAHSTNIRVVNGGSFTEKSLRHQLPLLEKRREAILYVKDYLVRWANFEAITTYQNLDIMHGPCWRIFDRKQRCPECRLLKRVRLIKHLSRTFMIFPVLDEVDRNVIGSVLIGLKSPIPTQGECREAHHWSVRLTRQT